MKLMTAAEYREMLATEFPSEEALKKYLQEHPKADRHRHTVKSPSGGGGGKVPEEKPKRFPGKGDVAGLYNKNPTLKKLFEKVPSMASFRAHLPVSRRIVHSLINKHDHGQLVKIFEEAKDAETKAGKILGKLDRQKHPEARELSRKEWNKAYTTVRKEESKATEVRKLLGWAVAESAPRKP